MAAPTANEIDPNERVVIVSCDTHIGPRLREDLREYCPKAYLEDFDDFTTFVEEKGGTRGLDALNATEGHFDPHARIRDLDADGTAAECIFHGSQNGQPVPFIISDPSLGADDDGPQVRRQLRARGGRPAHLQRVARRLLLRRARAPRRPRASPDVGHRRVDRRGEVGA